MGRDISAIWPVTKIFSEFLFMAIRSLESCPDYYLGHDLFLQIPCLILQVCELCVT